MSKNLCPENTVTFETSYQIKFETPLPAGTYTCSAIIESTDAESAACLVLFYYADGSTKEAYLTRKPNERVFKTVTLTQDSTRIRIYASEGHSLSSGDTATYSQLQIEVGDQMTDYVPYGDEPEPEPEPSEEERKMAELCTYFAAMAYVIPLVVCPDPTYRLTHLLRRYLDPDYQIRFIWLTERSYAERYALDLINGTTEMLTHIPQSDMEKYLHCMIGGTVDEMPDPNASELNFWMNEALEVIRNG